MKRRLRLALFSLGTAALVALAAVHEAPEPAPPVRAVPAPAVPDPAQPEPLEFGRAFVRQPLPDVGAGAFQARSWAPPAPPAPALTAPPRPAAPALPYVFLGRLESDEAPQVYLRRGKDLLVARTGEALDGAWRLDTIGPHGLVFTYLPLNEQKVLPHK